MTFARWFTLQFGPRKHSGEFTKRSDKDLEDMADTGRRAECELRKRQHWDSRRTAALYGWNAKATSPE